ncbi:hypothetical protein D3C80_1675910 [compost metagenome]
MVRQVSGTTVYSTRGDSSRSSTGRSLGVRKIRMPTGISARMILPTVSWEIDTIRCAPR